MTGSQASTAEAVTPGPAEAAGGVAVRVTGLSKSFGTTEVLKAVDLDISPGEFMVLLGPSGSGKSTLARCLAGVERVTSGEVAIGGRVVDDGRRQVPPERRNLAMVFQDYALWPHMTVSQNVSYAMRRKHVSPAEARARTEEALELMGLRDLAARYPGQLSGGQQQRVALARAVVGRPGLLLFDEPLSNLDADLRERLRVEISTLTHRFGATAVYITHDQVEAFALADRVGILEAGQLVQLDTPEGIYNSPATPFIARFTGTSAEWRGPVTRRDGDACTLRVNGYDVTCRSVGPLGVGEDGTVLVRPPAASLGATRTTSHGPDAPSSLPGVVTDVAFRGRGYDHVVLTPVGEITGVHAESPRRRDDRVEVHLDPRGCLAYRHSAGILPNHSPMP